MNMQQMIQAMNKVQRQYEKDKKVLDEKSFEYTANGAVKVTLKGDYSMVGIEFSDPEVLKEDAETVSDLIKLAYAEFYHHIGEFEKALNLYLDLIECGLNAEINVYDRLATCYSHVGEFEKAFEQFSL